MKSYIHFIRHGITEGNQKGWYYGSMDIPLAKEGLEELEKLVEENTYPPLLDADCYTSGLIRTEQTFKAIYGDIPHSQITALQEMNFGLWEGKTFEELKSEPLYEEWINCTDGTFHYPNGDSIKSFYERIQSGVKELLGYHRLKQLSKRHCNNDAVSIVVCHGGVIAAAMEYFFQNEKDNFWQWIPKPGHGYTVYFEDDEPSSYTLI